MHTSSSAPTTYPLPYSVFFVEKETGRIMENTSCIEAFITGNIYLNLESSNSKTWYDKSLPPKKALYE